MTSITIEVDGEEYDILYKIEELDHITSINVQINDSELQKYSGGEFNISLNNRDNILSYPVKNPKDYEVKGKILHEIFIQEKIDFGQEDRN